MTVRCPRCDTLYRAREDVEDDATFRCARCGHVFPAPGTEGDRDEPRVDDASERFRFDDERFEDETPEEPVPPPIPPPVREAVRPPGSGVARFALRACLLVTLTYAVLSLYLYTQPEAAIGVLRRVPIFGARLAESRVDPSTVGLTGVRGEYLRVRGDQLVFVVSGEAVNRATVAVQGIQVQGFVTGAETRRQIVFCGAAPRDVHDLSLREIALLQTIEPPREWALGPGQSAPCRIVFPSPPADLKEFGAEVVAVRAPRRRSVAG